MRTIVVMGSVFITFLGCLIYLSGFTASYLAALSQEDIRRGDGVAAVEKISLAQKLSPTVSIYPRLEAKYLYHWIIAEPRVRPLIEPIISSKLKQAIELNPYYYRHYTDASTILRNLGYQKESLKLFEMATSLVPNSNKLRNQLAQRYIQAQEYEKAQKQLDIAVSLVKNNSWSYESYYIAAQMREAQGDREGAIEYLYTSLIVSPNSPICFEVIKQLRTVIDEFNNIYKDHEKCGYFLEDQHKNKS